MARTRLEVHIQGIQQRGRVRGLDRKIELCYIIGADSVQAFSDFQLVVSQLNGTYEAKDDTMVAYVRWVWEATKLLKLFTISLARRIGRLMHCLNWRVPSTM